MALNAYARAITDRLLTPAGRLLARAGCTANGLTTAGLVLTAAGAGVVLAGYPRAGAWVLAVGGATDAFDGIVARERGTAGRFGAFYDSVADRVGDVLIFGTVAWLVRADPLLFGVAVFVLGGSQVTSYIRAKAESLGMTATVGVLERAERVIIILLAIHFGFVPLALWVLAAGIAITIGQRLRAVRRQSRAAGSIPGETP